MLHRRHPRPDSRRPGRTRRLVVALTGVAAALAGGVVAGPRVIGDAHAAGVPAGSPVGVAEHMWFQPGGMTFTGWTYDPSSPKAAISAYITVDNHLAQLVTANRPRPDIAKKYPAAGANHGFQTFVAIPQGKHRVCVRARNIGAGSNVNFRCQDRDLEYGPFGAIQTVQATGGQLTVSGWTLDYDNRTAPLTVALTVDTTTTSLVAADPNSAAQKAVPTGGANHGFTFRRSISQGRHSLCVRVTNLGYGTNTTLTCRTVSLNDSPRGHFDTAAQSGSNLRIRGWSFDPEAATSAATVLVKVDNTVHTVVARTTRTDVAKVYPSAGPTHGFDVSYSVAEGNHTVCVTLKNIRYGSDVALACKTARINFTPTAAVTALTATKTGATLAGWATDPDTSAAVYVQISLDGKAVTRVPANRTGSPYSGHDFTVDVNTKSGAHQLCAVALNAGAGTHNSAASCRNITLTLNPLGHFDTLTRASDPTKLRVVGWVFDPDTAATTPDNVTVTIDGKGAGSIPGTLSRPDVQKAFPSAGPNRGFDRALASDVGEHTVCLTSRNTGAGASVALGCKTINAVNPVPPSAPQAVTAQAGYGGATLTWTAPASDGGAPVTKYVISALMGITPFTVGPTTTTATITGLRANAAYSFNVTAVNVAGSSAAVVAPTVRTQASPPPQTTPAPVSTSRYIRNIYGASATDLTNLRNEGVADAKANPSGHGYLILLDIGGQDEYDGGVVLSATTRYISYANLVKNIQSYVDGYHLGQKASAPVTIAIGTNNDMDVTTTAGRNWADKVVDPVLAYAKKYTGMTIAGANDMEPGFRATYAQSKSWLTGYLAATTAPFVFNGSADGCAWTVINRGCNNGWSMSGLYYLSAGAAPVRMLNLPQIYNYTMADQWKYISLTGVAQSQPRINFAGTLTEWTACDQAGGCGSITGHSAWSRMWSNLQSDTRLKVGSLPYSTDLRIDR